MANRLNSLHLQDGDDQTGLQLVVVDGETQRSTDLIQEGVLEDTPNTVLMLLFGDQNCVNNNIT